MPKSKYSLAQHPEARQRALWLIRDYPNIKAKLEALDGFGAPENDGQPRAHNPHSTTEQAALERAALSAQIEAVDKAFERIPPEYRRGIWEGITQRKRYPDTAGIKTWKRWRQRVLWYTAHFAGYL